MVIGIEDTERLLGNGDFDSGTVGLHSLEAWVGLGARFQDGIRVSISEKWYE